LAQLVREHLARARRGAPSKTIPHFCVRSVGVSVRVCVRACKHECMKSAITREQKRCARVWWGVCWWGEGGMAGGRLGRWGCEAHALAASVAVAKTAGPTAWPTAHTSSCASAHRSTWPCTQLSTASKAKGWSGDDAKWHGDGRGRTGADPEGRWLGAVPQRQLAPARGTGGILLLGSGPNVAWGPAVDTAAGYSTSLTTQHACNMQHATCSVQHAAYQQRAAHSFAA
jgi:hypothetical protein